MSSAPSVLVLDDGELDHIHRMLKRLGADYVRLQNRQIRKVVEKPRDLLISSCERTLEMPELESSEDTLLEPVWVCVHGQDFLPLRERLRELGVHFLVHAALDQESLRLFLLQLLYRGPNQRKQLRLPLGDRIECGVVDAELEVGKLVDLTSGMGRIISPSTAEPGATMRIVLPEALGGKEKLEIQGPVLRSAECESRAGEPAFSILVRFDSLEGEARAQVDRLVSGEQIGTRVTPLADRPPRAPEALTPEPYAEIPLREPEAATHEPYPEIPLQEPEAATHEPYAEIPLWEPEAATHEPPAEVQESPAQEETAPATSLQRLPRWQYYRRVDVLDFDDMDASQTALGRDLSLGGVRITGHSELEVGAEVTLALYSGPREEPLVLDATVLRDDGEGGVALAFNSVSDSQIRRIQRICSTLPPLESLRKGGEEPERVVVAQVKRARR
jgi:hypothetical protein